MKFLSKIATATLFVLFSFNSNGQLNQTNYSSGTVTGSELETFHVPLKSTTHIISPEPISYVDINRPEVEGDLSDKKICRLKALPNTLKDGDRFTVTIVTNSFIKVYQLICRDRPNPGNESFVITINPLRAVALNLNNKMSEQQFKQVALQILAKSNEDKVERASAYGLKLYVNNIFVVDDYIFIDVEMFNKTNLAFDIDETRFKLKDKKIVKATISQDIEMLPEHEFYKTDAAPVRKMWRNIYAFKKFTFPEDKILSIEFSEKQVSGRKIELKMNYKKLLRAETLY
ncbi:MAG: conjugative transposon protein TraN [Sphingobacteriales bacterium 41-5]|nr:MAG: conjugative transposon protein TraN [Sphingobacteriales bacterium 41-5]